MIDVVDRGILNSKTPKVAQELFEEIVINSYQWHSSKAKPSKPTHVYEVDVVITLVVLVEALSKKIDSFSIMK